MTASNVVSLTAVSTDARMPCPPRRVSPSKERSPPRGGVCPSSIFVVVAVVVLFGFLVGAFANTLDGIFLLVGLSQ